MNTPTATAPKSAPTSADRLSDLLNARSKHSTYQELHPSLCKIIGITQSPAGKRESARWHYMNSQLDLKGKTVLDIGANTGYFSIAATEAGASSVTAIEGNAEHAEFIEAASQLLGCENRLTTQHRYFDFDSQASDLFDVTLCLNVLHHLGDDFGEKNLSLEQSLHGITQRLRNLSGQTRHCWFQLGFNWKGDRHRPLFSRGLKRELIDFVDQACAGHWSVESIAIYDPKIRCYEPANTPLYERFDELGEFLNRPLFLLKSVNPLTY